MNVITMKTVKMVELVLMTMECTINILVLVHQDLLDLHVP